MISLKNVYLNYTSKYYNLFNINLTVKKQDKIALVGDENSGKLEILLVMVGLQKINGGEVFFNKVQVNKVNFKTDANVGVVLKKAVLFSNKTVMQNLEYIVKIRNGKDINLKEICKKALEKYGLEGKANVKIKKLTGYERVLLQFARLALRQVDVYFIDDVFEGLEKKDKENIINIVKDISKKEKTIVLLTEEKTIAENLNYKTIEMNYGSIKGDKND